MDKEYPKEFLDKLLPKWICNICKDWFHMPFKNCKCEVKK
jgi:hypothetical protein